jgi:hypothetical protein
VPLRFVRTIKACLGVEERLVVRQPALTWLIWRGMLRWGIGFVEGAFAGRAAVKP